MTHLTAREIEILSLVARGLPDKQIARELELSLGRIKQATGQIATKLHALNRVQAVTIAFATGVLSLSETYAAMQGERVNA